MPKDIRVKEKPGRRSSLSVEESWQYYDDTAREESYDRKWNSSDKNARDGLGHSKEKNVYVYDDNGGGKSKKHKRTSVSSDDKPKSSSQECARFEEMEVDDKRAKRNRSTNSKSDLSRNGVVLPQTSEKAPVLPLLVDYGAGSSESETTDDDADLPPVLTATKDARRKSTIEVVAKKVKTQLDLVESEAERKMGCSEPPKVTRVPLAKSLADASADARVAAVHASADARNLKPKSESLPVSPSDEDLPPVLVAESKIAPAKKGRHKRNKSKGDNVPSIERSPPLLKAEGAGNIPSKKHKTAPHSDLRLPDPLDKVGKVEEVPCASSKKVTKANIMPSPEEVQSPSPEDRLSEQPPSKSRITVKRKASVDKQDEMHPAKGAKDADVEKSSSRNAESLQSKKAKHHHASPGRHSLAKKKKVPTATLR